MIEHSRDEYPFLDVLESHASALEKNHLNSHDFAKACELVNPLREDFEIFIKNCEAKS